MFTLQIPEYFNEEGGTGSLLDMSSSGLESSNKTERFLIHLRFACSMNQCMSFIKLAMFQGVQGQYPTNAG